MSQPVPRGSSSSFFSRSKNLLSLSSVLRVYLLDLANSQEILEESSGKNQEVVLAFYNALRSRDVGTVHKILAADLEWWFHGPPTHQFMMRLLTGADTSSEKRSSNSSFEFKPEFIQAFGSFVIAEGCDPNRSISWVHAWTVKDGIITQVREYFNTSLTVVQSEPSDYASSPSSSSSSSSSPAAGEISPVHCPSLWESSLSDRVGKSVPGLVLAI